MWLDGTAPPQLLSSMKPYQRVNHFPGMYAIARKSNLCMNLNKLRKELPEDYDFYPATWFLPSEFQDLKKHFALNGGSYIAKPAASSQGKGIFIVQDLQQLNDLGDYIVQRYVESPLLIEGLKFDMRIYVLVTGCDPLRVFIHKEGLARLATEKYRKPCGKNLDEVCMHLTNYSVNKQNPKFIKNLKAEEDGVGHKRSLRATLKNLVGKGLDVEEMWENVSDIVIKTLCSILPNLKHTYNSCKPDDMTNAMCFEILGFDILLDSDFRPWLLEVNHSPSFETASPLDKKIKSIVIRDCLALLGLNERDKQVYESWNRARILERSVFKKTFTDKMQGFYQEKEVAKEERNEFEENNSRGFRKIYPQNEKYYEGIIGIAQGLWERFTGSKVKEIKTRPLTCGRKSITPQPKFVKQRSVEKYQVASKTSHKNKLSAYRDLSILRIYK